MTNDELAQEIGVRLIKDPKICSWRWQQLVSVAQLMKLCAKVNGFACETMTADAVPTSPSNPEIPDL